MFDRWFVCSADDAEVVPPEDDGCADDGCADATVCGCSADDAEVIPPRESAGLRERRRHGVRLQCF